VLKENDMGNPAWGHGYHQGFADGAVRGGLIGAGATIAAGVVIAGVALGYRELKTRSFAKREQESAVDSSNDFGRQESGKEHGADEGITKG
jgi:hypothetical protein